MSTGSTASIVGGKVLRKRLAAMSDDQRTLARLQTETVREAKALVPRKTGNLGRTIRAGYLSARDALVVVSAPYARYVEEGTGVYGPRKRPFDIVPRSRKALRFPRAGVPLRLSGAVRASHAGSKGSYVFARKVTVQGARPQPFLVPAAQKAVSGTRIKAILIDAWNKAG